MSTKESTVTSSGITLFDMLIADFSEIPSPLKEIHYDNYAVVNTNAAIVPNPYIPSFRIFAYNITGLSSAAKDISSDPYLQMTKEAWRRRSLNHEHARELKKPKCERKKYRNTWRCHFDKPWYSDSESPSRSNSLWSPLGYAQVCWYPMSSSLHNVLMYFTVLHAKIGRIRSDARPRVRIGVHDLPSFRDSPQ